MSDTRVTAEVDMSGKQNTGNPVLDATVNLISLMKYSDIADLGTCLEYVHEKVLALALKEPGGLRHFSHAHATRMSGDGLKGEA